MPDAQGFPTPDELINGPQKKADVPFKPTPEQRKALSLIMSGMPFLVIAMRPTVRQGDGHIPIEQASATGADFLTSIAGDPDVLRAVKDALPGVIDRLYGRSGLL